MSSRMSNLPLVYVQYERSLPTGEVVVRGPAYRRVFLNSSEKNSPVRIFDSSARYEDSDVRIDFSNIRMLSSEEMFGYDPITTEYPQLRRVQNYNSVILRGDHRQRGLVGSFVIPADTIARPCQFTFMRESSLIREFGDSLLAECSAASREESIVIRFEGDSCGVVAVRVHDLINKSLLTAHGISIGETEYSPEHRIRLFGLLGGASTATRHSSLAELIVGDVREW